MTTTPESHWNIQTHAYKKGGKKTKADIAEMLSMLYDRESDPDIKQELASAYKHFMPKPGKNPTTILEWVAKALGNEEARPYLHHIYSDGNGTVVATDGQRLHLAPLDLPYGYYDHQGNRIEKTSGEDQFPDFWRVIPEAKEQAVIDYDEVFETKHHGKKLYAHPFVTQDSLKTGLQMPMIEAALSYGGDYTLKRKADRHNEPARFDFEDGRIAVIMPIAERKIA